MAINKTNKSDNKITKSIFLQYLLLCLQLYQKSAMLSLNNLKRVFISAIADLITLFLTILVLGFFAKIIEGPLTEFLVNLPNPEKPASNAVLILIAAFLVMYALLYAIFSFIQPAAWRNAHLIAGSREADNKQTGNKEIFNKKTDNKETHHAYHPTYNSTYSKYKPLMKYFLKTNLFFIVILAVINLYDDVFYTINTITGIIVINKTFLYYSYLALLSLFGYLAVISYSTLLSLKQALMFSITNFIRLFMPLFFIALTFIVINYIMVFAALLHPLFTNIFGIVLFIPAISFARIYLILAINKLKNI